MTERLKEFYIDNTTSVAQTITLLKETSCGIFEPVEGFSQIAPANTETMINFPEDGIYQVYLDGAGESEGTARYFKDLFTSMIVFIESAICGTTANPCNNMTPCNGDVNYLNNAIAKTLMYISVNNPAYDTALDTAIQKIRCSAIDTTGMLLKMEKYTGKSDASQLLAIELSHIYMELYVAEKALTDPSDYTSLDSIYNYDMISYCMQRLGVVDCAAPAPLPGVLHSSVLTVEPSIIGQGVSTNISVSYRFTANDDVFVSVIDTNIPNVDIGKFDGFTYQEIIAGETTAETYYITYSYTRGGVTYQNTVSDSTIAYTPQWFGGETTTADFSVGGVASAATIEASFANISAAFQSSSNATSSNTGTLDKYIYWITKNPVKFYIGAFEILSGPWDAACDPNSYAIIHKTITTTLEDGVTTETLHFYRTCPLQDLTGQTLTYELKQ